MLISDTYRALNAEMHRSDPEWGSNDPSPWIVMMLAKIPGSILDYGAGKCAFKKLKSRDIRFYDPAVPEIADSPESADIVICNTVLEHVEPECIGAVLDHIKLLARRCVIIKVTTAPSFKLLPDGTTPHRIIKPANWWVGELLARWNLVFAEATRQGLRFIGGRGDAVI